MSKTPGRFFCVGRFSMSVMPAKAGTHVSQNRSPLRMLTMGSRFRGHDPSDALRGACATLDGATPAEAKAIAALKTRRLNPQSQLGAPRAFSPVHDAQALLG